MAAGLKGHGYIFFVEQGYAKFGEVARLERPAGSRRASLRRQFS